MTLSENMRTIHSIIDRHKYDLSFCQIVLSDLLNNPISYEKGIDIIQPDGSFISVVIIRTGWLKKLFCVLTGKTYSVYNVSVTRQ